MATSISLRPYPGRIIAFRDLKEVRKYYERCTGKKYPYSDEATGGRYIKIEDASEKECDTRWLIYAKRPHVFAHEAAHVLLKTFESIGAGPESGNGEPFCYMLSQVMIDAGFA